MKKSTFSLARRIFFQGLVDSIERRFPSNDIMTAAEVLDENRWPEQEEERMLYGDKEITTVAKCVSLNAAEVLSEFREYKMTKKLVSPTLKNLICKLSVLPVSTATCERGFSAMNAQHTSVRNRLRMEVVSSLLFISINGLPLSVWDPTQAYVTEWLKSGRHSSTDKHTGKKSL